MISFNCLCGAAVSAPAEWAGKRVKCRACGQAMVVPAVAAAPLVPPASVESGLPLAYADINLQRPGAYGGELALGRAIGRPRNVLWFLFVSVGWIALTAAAFFFLFQATHERSPSFSIPLLLFAVWLLSGIGVLVCWLILVHATHRDVWRFTGGRYPISPAKAVGFSFIPGFSGFWIVYMPWRLAGEIDRLLQLPQGRGSKTTVLVLQIVSIPLMLAAAPLAPVMYSISMLLIQRGLNRLWIAAQPTGAV